MKKTTPHNLNLILVTIFYLLLCGLSLTTCLAFIGTGELSDSQVRYITKRQLLYYKDEFGDRGERVIVPPNLSFLNPRLRDAYIALQAWKQTILSDPFNFTATWVGSDVCHYKGVFCAPALDDPSVITVAGVDLNHADIAGYLPEELGLLRDLALFHINTNRFCGTVPQKFRHLRLLFELDLSNNRFAGVFPRVVLSLPSLKFLDLRFNEFEGSVPPELFDKDLDAIFINHNRFKFELPNNFGNSPVSVIVVANNDFHGCVPESLVHMRNLNEIIFMNNHLQSCLPSDLGRLRNMTVFDVSFNRLLGQLPESVGDILSLEQLDVAHNYFSGRIPSSICKLPNLKNFTYSYNFFTSEPPVCLGLPSFDDRRNCIPARPVQRSARSCSAFLSHPIDCSSFGCGSSSPTPIGPSVPSPPVFVHQSPPPPSPPPPPPPFQPPPTPHVYVSPPPPAPSYEGPLPPIFGLPYASPPPPPLY